MKKNLLILVTLLLSVGQMWAENPVEINSATVAFPDGKGTYDGVEISLDDLKVTINGAEKTEGFTITENSGKTLKDAGEYSFTVTGDNAVFSGAVSEGLNLTIQKATLTASNFTITEPEGGFVYNGTKYEPEVTGMFNDSEFNDFAKTYGSNTNVSEGISVSVTITEGVQGNFTNGSNSIALEEKSISPADITDAVVALEGTSGLSYTGSAIEGVSIASVKLEELDVTYETPQLQRDGENANEIKDAGSYTYVFTGNGNFTGTKTSEVFTVAAYNLETNASNISIVDQIYTGKQIEIDPSGIRINGVKFDANELKVTVLEEAIEIGEEYKVNVESNSSANFTGTATVKFNIVAPPTYNTITLDVTGGIELINYASGSYTIESDGYLFLQFRAEAKGGEVVLEVDGETVKYTDNGTGYASYILAVKEKDHTVKMYLKAYTVEFPAYEGVTFEGEGTAEYGKPYSFRFTLADDIDPTKVQVFVNDQLVEPDPVRSATYTVSIEKVTGPIEIRIEGVDPVGVGVISENKVYSQDGVLVVETAAPVLVQIYNMTGKQTFIRTVNGYEMINLSRGIYIVRLNKEVQKVIVK